MTCAPGDHSRLGRSAGLLAFVVLLTTACSGDGNDASTATTRGRCGSVASAPDPVDTFMTLPQPSPTIEFEVTVQPDEVCIGDTVRFAVHIANHTSEDVEVSPELVVTEPLPHVVLARADPVSVRAGDERTIEVEAVVPVLAPGSYDVFVRDWTSTRATLTVRDG
jgi:hypothetical protein